METLDATTRPSIGLPSITNLESDKIKREEAGYQRKHSAPAMVSPLHNFLAPSHTYSSHQSSTASAVSGPTGGLVSPPESRRTSGDEKEQRMPARQSLPSIHEALGAEQPLSSYPAPPPPAPVSAPQPFMPPSSTTSPCDIRGRTFSVDHMNSQGPPNPFSHPRSPFMSASSSTGPPPLAAPTQSDSLPRPSFSSTQHNPKLPTLHPLRTTQSPPTGTPRSYPPYSQQPASAFEAPAPQSAGSMHPQYGYTQYPPNYPLSAPAPSAPNSGYPPSAAAFSAPPRYPAPSWRDGAELGRHGLEEKKLGRTSLAPYGESVKRHLESFDLEASLNEMAEGAGRVTDFSKVYRQRAHEHQRSGMTPQSMPRLEEVDEMLKQSEKIASSLKRMREVVYNNHQANLVEPPRESHYRPVNGYEGGDQGSFHDDAKGGGGFGGAELKKRRPRAAPPGRCHSCNRAETPEWRRGPDGARTLCNACGLHYAKLTRKMGGKQAMASSSLRPKSIGEGS